MNLYERAMITAIKAHGDQKRKYTNEPYIVHPIRVASIIGDVAGYTYSDLKSLTYYQWQDAYAAALLHDVLEDTEYTASEMLKDFGSAVTNLVLEVTDVSKKSDGNREKRKEIDRNHIANASFFGKTIKLADLIDNTKTIVKYDPDFAKVYIKEKELLLEVLTDGHPFLYDMANYQIKSAKEILY